MYLDIHFHLQDFILLLFNTIEEHLGSIDSWPAYVLEYLFSDHPTPVRLDKLKEVIAFFYENDVPCTLACQSIMLVTEKFLYL
jgi:hypothetical protein